MIMCWNVNGLSAILKKSFVQYVVKENPDIICLQEIKGNLNKSIDVVTALLKWDENPNVYWNVAEKAGYSGTAIITRSNIKPVKVYSVMDEGRVIIAEFADFFLVNVYVPNSGEALKRLDFKLAFNKKLFGYLEMLKKSKNVILCGDMNVARDRKDLARPDSNTKTAGYTIEERHAFNGFLARGWIDVFREKSNESIYTYWSYKTGARARNVGWRIDYFVVNEEFYKKNNLSVLIRTEIEGSDHCPILLLGVRLECF